MTARVALIGANGYGRYHRKAMAPLQAAGTLELVAVCDLAPVHDEPGLPLPPPARVYTDYRQLLATTAELDAVVVSTPPHTHLEIAMAAARAGADVLVEKPPVVSLAEHHALAAVLTETGRACQVGFQALGSAALAELTAAVADGSLGRVHGIGVAGAWQRPDRYYQRAPWAGHRSVDGHPTLDGALSNPFAHAVMQCLAIAEAAAGRPVWPVRMELERYRTRSIEVDDTAVLRIHLDTGPPVLVAVTLCADEHRDPEIIVHTGQGPAVLGYTTDRLQLPGMPARVVPGRTGLLADLLAGGDLIAPLHRTTPFTALVEAVSVGPVPTTIDTSFQDVHGDGLDRVVTVPGIGDVLWGAARRMALPSELSIGWAAPPVRTGLPTTPTPDAATGMQHIGG